jgi:hypothetical protein
MKNQLRYFTFALLKVVRHGDLRQAIRILTIKLSVFKVQASRATLPTLMRFFYCVLCKNSTLLNGNGHSDQDKGACKRYTLIHKIIGSGKLAYQQAIKVMFTTSDLNPKRHTFSETTQGLKCGLLSLSVNPHWGKIIEGGDKLHSLASPLAHSACRLRIV